MTSNEIRQIVGLKPASDPKADELVNSNISQPEMNKNQPEQQVVEENKEGENQDEGL